MYQPGDRIETDLVALAKQEDSEAFTELVVRARPVCLTVARSILGDAAEAEDQVQNGFLKAWRNISQFREDASFTTWMCRIVTNECLMVVRRRNRVLHVSLDESPSDGISHALRVRDTQAGPEETVASEEIRDLLSRELVRVPKIFRTVLELGEVHGLPVDEMAAHLGISTAAAKSRLLRARRELRSRMEAHCGRMGFAALLP